ncbi:hypothetical protein PBCV1_a055L [Paramecium bursaria Chlorella virus 1]|uniref:Uncharacterized protein n=1 Tax=Paramecium bursaria Chlorella virus 1 TaxID=10506 RepID=Q89390_PBCV1|nr:hypothetical protein PBCV1_a055L [Paramecium bursaria Chlorella virus 1]AAC96423.2 hypothetical protein [Paramecium bursaria Chlorella virus 1]
MECTFHQRAVQTENVRFLDNIWKRHIFHTHFLHNVIFVNIISDDTTCHRLNQFNEFLRNLSGSDNTDCLISNFTTYKTFHGIITSLHSWQYKLNVSAQCHHVCKSEFRYGTWGIRWNSIHIETKLFRVFDI